MDLIKNINDSINAAKVDAAEQAAAAEQASADEHVDTSTGKSISDYMADIAQQDVDKT